MEQLSDEQLTELSQRAFKTLEGSSSVEIQLDPIDAFVLALNLSLAFQNPINQQEPAMETMKKIFLDLQKILGERSPAASKVMELSVANNPWVNEPSN